MSLCRGVVRGRGDRPGLLRTDIALQFDGQDYILEPEGLLKQGWFLLDAERRLIAGAQPTDRESVTIEPLRNGDAVVGWIGFTPMGKALPPEARRFLQGQLRLMGITLLAALAVAMLDGEVVITMTFERRGGVILLVEQLEVEP